MNKVLNLWMKIWLYVMAAGGIILILLVVVFWNQFDWATRLLYFPGIGLVLHVLEEWRFPGGFHYIYNLMKNSDIPDRYPMNQVSDMLTNFGALIVFFMSITINEIIIGVTPLLAIPSFLFCLSEVIAHTFLSIRSNKVLNTKERKIIYNPGFLTTYLVFLPVSIGFIYIFATGILQTLLTDWLWGVVLLGCMGLLLITIPERVLQNKNSPYPFTGKYEFGYYKKYID
ncbi:MAG: HXXEE domain-containing protein [Promethearchaeota archaeon]